MDGKGLDYVAVKKLESMPTKLELIATIARLINQVGCFCRSMLMTLCHKHRHVQFSIMGTRVGSKRGGCSGGGKAPGGADGGGLCPHAPPPCVLAHIGQDTHRGEPPLPPPLLLAPMPPGLHPQQCTPAPPPPPAPLQVPTKVARGINQVPTKLAYGVKALADGDDNKEQMVSDVFPKPEAA